MFFCGLKSDSTRKGQQFPALKTCEHTTRERLEGEREKEKGRRREGEKRRERRTSERKRQGNPV